MAPVRVKVKLMGHGVVAAEVRNVEMVNVNG